ncbi:transporter [Candidatus Auribacterota bacterium]
MKARTAQVKKMAVYLFAAFIFTCCGGRTLFAGPITIFNGTAEPVKKGKFIVETHYGYYQNELVKNTAYWGLVEGNGGMDNINDLNTKYIVQAYTSEFYYAFTDRFLAGIVVPYVVRHVKTPAHFGGNQVSSNGFGDMSGRFCFNILDPKKAFIGFSIAGAVVAPTGSEDDNPPRGNGRVELIAGALFTKIVNKKLKLHLTLCYDWMLKNNKYKYWQQYSRLDAGDEFHFGVVAEYALFKKLHLICEVNGWIAPESRDRHGKKIPYTDCQKIDIVPGIKYKINDNITFELALNVTLKPDSDFDYYVAPEVGFTFVF